MSELTKEEKAWVKKVNALLAKCPSTRIGFYTIGDGTVFLFDANYQDEISNIMDNSHSDWSYCVYAAGAGFSEVLEFPNPVESVAG
ncbi:hypothetical protein [Pectobacterium parmentieri]|uniref:hypothetical protein n=1 Tax=Pectobacterium parmentieri TaxID=1905730 RepID=UPI000D6148C8|nr:hypothetical protein [Pectobacterium parmentieri]PWD66545.1 hypothetical protein DF211_01980 [Pectobacterium parmentieri]